MKLFCISLCLATLICDSAFAALSVTDVSAQQRYPWNGKVDVSFTITGEEGKKYATSFVARDVVGGTNLAMKTVYKSDGSSAALTNQLEHGTYKWVWDAAADLPDGFNCEQVVVDVNARFEPIYMVVDLSAGSSATNYPVTYLSSVPDGGWNNEYKTTRLVLRLIPKGTYIMGSPVGESGRYSEEIQHQVTLTKDFYIGVFELTQKQYSLIVGTTPSSGYGNGDAFPVYFVSYNDIRGSVKGAKWPSSDVVDGESIGDSNNSFLGRLRMRTGVKFDLPTEAQWEYACRAGTTGRYAGTGILDAMGWYRGNAKSTSHTVGIKTANDFGLYDMHGNVQEWTRDWFNNKVTAAAVVDPAPTNAHAESCRVRRGGSWYDDENDCRSADRNHNSVADAWNSTPGHTAKSLGFRVSVTLD